MRKLKKNDIGYLIIINFIFLAVLIFLWLRERHDIYAATIGILFGTGFFNWAFLTTPDYSDAYKNHKLSKRTKIYLWIFAPISILIACGLFWIGTLHDSDTSDVYSLMRLSVIGLAGTLLILILLKPLKKQFEKEFGSYPEYETIQKETDARLKNLENYIWPIIFVFIIFTPIGMGIEKGQTKWGFILAIGVSFLVGAMWLSRPLSGYIVNKYVSQEKPYSKMLNSLIYFLVFAISTVIGGLMFYRWAISFKGLK